MRHYFGSLDDDLFRGAVPIDVADAGDEFVVPADLPATNARPS
jgi:HSP20 family molecular chaperone IbpA